MPPDAPRMLEAKRVFDLAVCAALAPVAAVIAALAALAVRITSGRPVLHRGRRLGRDGVPFDILKFRTMTVVPAVPGATVTRITAAGDRRITPVGRWLRRSKLDELPQLLNVLRGEMSLVGPRPEDPYYAAHYTGRFAPVLGVRPGITGPAAVAYRHEEELLARAAARGDVDYYETTLLPAKLELDLDYARRHSVRGDLVILGRTVRAVVRRPDTVPA